MGEIREHHDDRASRDTARGAVPPGAAPRLGLVSCALIACGALSCAPVALAGEAGDSDGAPAAAEPVGETQDPLAATAVRVENHPTRASLPTPDPALDLGRLAFLTSDAKEPLGFWAVTNGSRWTPLGPDVYNVVAYGADPRSGGQDDQPAIMAAIHAAAAARGGVIYFPRGEYDIAESIVLPRSYMRPLTLQGEGRFVSLITTLTGEQGDHLLPSDQPVIDFDPSQSLTSRFYGFRDLQISRRNDGHVFRHTRTSPTARLHQAVFERVIFLAADDPDGASGPAGSTDLVLIQGGLLCTMNSVTFGGGDTALVLEDSSHMSLRDSGTFSDHASNQGIRLIGGGSHSLYRTRVEATDGGAALSIEGGTTGIGNIQIDGLFGEGKRTHTFVDLRGSPLAPVRNVVMKDVHVPTPWGPSHGVNTPSYGIYVNSHVRNVQVLSGSFGTWGTNLAANGGQPIHVEAGARDVDIHMATDDPIEQGGLGDYAAVEPGATRVRVELLDGTSRPYLRAEGMIDAWTVEGQTAYVGASETVRAASAAVITTILQAHTGFQDTPPQAGQRLILLGTPEPAELISNAGNLRLATHKFHLCDSAVIQLVYDGMDWQEVSRSVN